MGRWKLRPLCVLWIPFLKAGIGNGSNPFVADVETGHVSVCDDRQEFNER